MTGRATTGGDVGDEEENDSDSGDDAFELTGKDVRDAFHLYSTVNKNDKSRRKTALDEPKARIGTNFV